MSSSFHKTQLNGQEYRVKFSTSGIALQVDRRGWGKHLGYHTIWTAYGGAKRFGPLVKAIIHQARSERGMVQFETVS